MLEVEAVETFAGQLTPQKAAEHVPYPTFATVQGFFNNGQAALSIEPWHRL